MKFSREQYLEIMTFGHFERPMFVELFGPLIGLDKEWRAQGASEDEINMTAFDWDYTPVVQCGGHTGFYGCPAERIIEENDSYLIKMDGLGRKTKLPKGYATLPLPLDFPVKDMDSWLKLKPFLEFREERIDWDQVNLAKKLQKEGHLVVAYIPGGFDYPRELMGEEVACLSYYLQPELMFDIIHTMTEMSFKVLDRISDELKIDQLSVHEDMAGKTGPLIGPNEIEIYIKPYFRKIWDMLHSKGTQLFDMDSDGNMNPILDILIECGLNSMHPFEPASGMDIVQVRKKYGKQLVIRGGIDKHVLRKDKEAILKELEYKMQPFMQEGGVIFGLDHRIPNGTPIENYRYYVETGREILGLPKSKDQSKGWGRMAF
jgi:uroporphyrinogen-III decarboxylase